jgi:hypothetical protein
MKTTSSPPSPAAPTDGLVCPVCLSPVSEPWSCVPCSNKYGIQPAIPVTTEDEIGLAHAQSWPKAGLPDFGEHLDTPCPSPSLLPLVAPVGVTGQSLDVPHAVCPTCGGFYDAGGTCLGCAYEDDYRPELDALEDAPAPVSPSLPEESFPCCGQTMGMLCCNCTVTEKSLSRDNATLKADVERLRDLLEQAHDDLAVTYKAIEIHGGPDVSVGQFRRLDQYKAAALSLAEVGRK